MVVRKLIDVFGRLGDDPESYIEREGVDRRIDECLESGKHVVVYGRPGQGKTSLVRRALTTRRSLYIQCQRGQRVPDLYRRILAELGASITTGRKLTKKRRLSADIKIFSGGGDTEIESSEAQMTIDLGNIGDVLAAVNRSGFEGWIVLNDFQNLAESAKRRVATDIKYIAEQGPVRVLLVATWSGAIRFLDLNEDASSFVVHLEVPPWSPEDLRRILDAAEYLLNVEFSDQVKDRCIQSSAGCVRNLHEIAHELCRSSGILKTRGDRLLLDDVSAVERSASAVYGQAFQAYEGMLSRYLREIRIDVAAMDDLVGMVRPWTGSDDPNDAQRIAHWLADGGISQENRILDQEYRLNLRLAGELVAYDWAGTNEPLRLSDEDYGASAEDARLGQRSGALWAAKRLIKAQSKRDFRPVPLRLDRESASLSVVDSKFLAYLTGLEAEDIERLRGQAPLSSTPPGRSIRRLRDQASRLLD